MIAVLDKQHLVNVLGIDALLVAFLVKAEYVKKRSST